LAETKKTTPKKTKTWRKALLIVLVVFALLESLHLYIRYNAVRLIRDLVYEETNGQYQLEMKKLRIRYFPLRVRLEEVQLTAANKQHQKNFEFTASEVFASIGSVYQLVVHRALNVGTIMVRNPHVTVAAAPSQKTNANNNFIFTESGNLYQYISGFASRLKIKGLAIINGKVNITDKTLSKTLFGINHIFFSIENFSLNDPKKSKDGQSLKTDDIRLVIREPDIILADSSQHLLFKNLLISTAENRLRLDNFFYRGYLSDADTSMSEVVFPELKLENTDFYSMYKDGVIKADSLVGRSPEFRFVVRLQRTEKKKKALSEIIHDIVQYLPGDLNIKYIAVKQATLNATAQTPKSTKDFNLSRNDFEIFNLRVLKRGNPPIDLDSIRFVLRDSANYGPDSSFKIIFTGFKIEKNNTAVLSNFSMVPGEKASQKFDDKIFIQEVRLEAIDLPDLFNSNKLYAQNLVFKRPTLLINLPDNPQRKGNRGFFLPSWLGNIARTVEMKTITVENGAISVRRAGDELAFFRELNVQVDGPGFLKSDNIEALAGSIRDIAFEEARAGLPGVKLDASNGHINQYGDISVSRIYAEIPDQLKLASRTLVLQGMDWAAWRTARKLHVQRITGDSLYLTAHPKAPTGDGPQQQGITGIEIDELNINRMLVDNAQFKDLTVQLLLHSIKGTGLNIVPAEKKFDWNTLMVNGTVADINSDRLKVQMHHFSINHGQPSEIRDIVFQMKQEDHDIRVEMPRMSFNATKQPGTLYNWKIQALQADYPLVKVTLRPKDQPKEKTTVQPAATPFLVEMNNTTINEATLQLALHKPDMQLQVNQQRLNIAVDKGKFQSFNLHELLQGTIDIDGGTLAVNLEGKSDLKLNAQRWSTMIDAAGKPLWAGKNDKIIPVKAFNMQHLDVALHNKAKGVMLTSKDNIVNVQHWSWNVDDKDILGNMAEYHQNIQVHNQYTHYVNPKTTLQLFNVDYTGANGTITLDSASLHPTQDAHTFFKTEPYETDYMQAAVKGIRVHQFSSSDFFRDSTLRSPYITAQAFYVNVIRDKNLPDKAEYKALPQRLLREAAYLIDIDSVGFRNGHVSYAEVSEQTKDTGRISFGDIQGKLYGVHGREVTTEDTLRWDATGTMMGTIPVRWQYKAPIADTFSSFENTISFGLMPLNTLNPVVTPLTRAIVYDGIAQPGELYFKGNDYYSYGHLDLFYNNLHVGLNPNDPANIFWKRWLVTLADKLVIRRNNDKRGLVYFDRMRDRFLFNFVAKNFINGVKSNVGVQSQKKVLKKIKAAQAHPVPRPIPPPQPPQVPPDSLQAQPAEVHKPD